MGKVKTYKKQPSLQQQQPPPSSQPLQKQLQFIMPSLVEYCVSAPDKPIEHDGDRSINENTDVKWPVNRFMLYRVLKKKQKKELIGQMRCVVCPKSPFMVFFELFTDIPIYLQEHPLDNIMNYTATFDIDGQMYHENDISKIQALEKVCEKFLRIMLASKLSEQSVQLELYSTYNEMEFGEYDSVSRPKGLFRDKFPWEHFVSLAMYNLMNHWKLQPVESTVIKSKSNTKAMKKFLKNPKNYNPILLMNLMKPDAKYTVTLVRAKYPTLFQVECLIDGFIFIGQGPRKTTAKKECCILAIKYFWKFDFHAIKND